MAIRIELGKTSRYRRTPLLQGNATLSLPNREITEQHYLWATWEAVEFDLPPDPADDYYQLAAKDIGRLDNLAWDFYGDPELWWLIAYVNRITDPLFFTDFLVDPTDDPKTGELSLPEVRIPALERVTAVLNQVTSPRARVV